MARFNGAYSNPTLLTASIEELPLGDLNWFPAEKAKWEANKEAIQNHILALNESRYHISGVGVKELAAENSFGAFPNPASDVVTIKSSKELKFVKVYDVAGKLMKTIDMKNSLTKNIGITDLNKGVYLLKAESKTGDTYSSKFVVK